MSRSLLPRKTNTKRTRVRNDSGLDGDSRGLERAIAAAARHTRGYLATRLKHGWTDGAPGHNGPAGRNARFRRNGSGNGRRVSEGRRFLERLDPSGQQDWPEQERRELALLALRESLAMHQPVAKECVLRRLLDHASCASLARELHISRQEVTRILGRARKWVHRFTHHFDDDWYWLGNG